MDNGYSRIVFESLSIIGLHTVHSSRMSELVPAHHLPLLVLKRSEEHKCPISTFNLGELS